VTKLTAYDALVAAVEPAPSSPFAPLACIVGPVNKTARRLARDYEFDLLLRAYVALREERFLSPLGNIDDHQLVNCVCTLLAVVAAVHVSPKDVARTLQSLIDDNIPNAQQVASEIAWSGRAGRPRAASNVDPSPRFLRSELLLGSVPGLMNKALYDELIPKLTQRGSAAHPDFVPFTRAEYLQRQPKSYHFTPAQRDLWDALCSEWAGTLLGLVETVRSLCPSESRHWWRRARPSESSRSTPPTVPSIAARAPSTV
jgi:hypothetical protein